jgi:hypothetical protein
MVKVIFKARLACCQEGTQKSLENILTLQNKTGKNNPLPMKTQAQLLHVSSATIRVYKSAASMS